MPITPEKLQKAKKAFEASRKGSLWSTRNIILAALALLYLISPIDLVPDWIFPIVGWLDDLGIITLVALWIYRHRSQPPDEQQEKPSDAPPLS